MNEEVRIAHWLIGKLRADNGAGGLFGAPALVTGVWLDLIPPEIDLPAIRISELAIPADVTSVNGTRILIGGVYVVAAVVDGSSYGPAVPIADRIDAVLQRASGPGRDGVIVESCIRERPFKLPEDDGDVHFRHLGGVYRAIAS
jgi:hypothetical protein